VRGGGHHNAGTIRVRSNLVDVAIDVDGGLPRSSVDRGIPPTWTLARRTAPSGVAVIERIPSGVPRAAVDDCRARIPSLAPRDRVKAAKLLEFTISVDSENAGIDVDQVADSHATSEIQVRRRYRAPYPIERAPAKSAAVDDRDRAATPVRCEASYRLIAELVVDGLADDDQASCHVATDTIGVVTMAFHDCHGPTLCF
jgi:hypothetical protein